MLSLFTFLFSFGVSFNGIIMLYLVLFSIYSGNELWKQQCIPRVSEANTTEWGMSLSVCHCDEIWQWGHTGYMDNWYWGDFYFFEVIISLEVHVGSVNQSNLYVPAGCVAEAQYFELWRGVRSCLMVSTVTFAMPPWLLSFANSTRCVLYLQLLTSKSVNIEWALSL